VVYEEEGITKGFLKPIRLEATNYIKKKNAFRPVITTQQRQYETISIDWIGTST
jgi:hypothetical protein